MPRPRATWWRSSSLPVAERYSKPLCKEIEALAGQFLPGWRIILTDEPPGPEDADNLAVVSWPEHAFEIRLWLSDKTLASEPDLRRVTIIHELIHPLFRELRAEFKPDGGPKADRWEHFEEMIIERLSVVGMLTWPGVTINS